MFRFTFGAVVLSGLVMAQLAGGTCSDGKKHYRTAIRHIERGGIGYEEGYTTFEAFLASDPSQWKATPFLDARGHVFNNRKWAANIGAGIRALLKNRVYGINTYYDYRNTRRLHSNQVGVGLETLGELFDFRINGYFPVGTKISNPYHTVFKTFSGHHMILSQKFQSAMKGADAEFGFHCGGSKSFDFYAAAGPYYFIGKKDPAWGGKARVIGTIKDMITLEISDSYDSIFHNKFQGQIGLAFSFGPKSKVKEQGRTCKVADRLNGRMLQPVGRQEIIAFDKIRKKTVAIDPATGLPYFFVFVDNTSHSDGTYESPYHSLAQAQDNSSPNDIIYVFPGDGTTTGMDSGITLKPNQKFWGSGILYTVQTSQGTVSIPVQSGLRPTITNTNINTDGNAITLATNNEISGFIITSAMNDAIFGADPQTLTVSSCTITNTTTYAIEASFSEDASISLMNNQFLDNVNGVILTLNGTSSIVCSDNLFTGQTSISSIPVEISSNNNILNAVIKNNVFDSNTTGSVRFDFNSLINANIALINNTITNNGSGSQASLGSSVVILSTGTNDSCTLLLSGNTFSGNASNALYLYTSGAITALEAAVSENTISNNGGSALIIATPTDSLTLVATDNTIIGGDDNGIAIISSGTTSNGTVTINSNTITDIGNASNGIAISQDFSTLSLTLQNNSIDRCEGTGILSYAPSGIDSLILNISDNTISNCENLSSNAASGLDIEQFSSLAGIVASNTLSGNNGIAVVIGSTLTSPAACLTFTGNSSSTDYSLTNPVDGLFNLSPCNVDAVNEGVINMSGVINLVQSCSSPTPCPP